MNKLSPHPLQSLALGLGLLTLSSCGVFSAGSKAMNKLQRGMTTEEVIATIGKPSKREIDKGNKESWSYRYPYEYFTLHIDFEDGKLVRTTSERWQPPVPQPAPAPPPVVVPAPHYPVPEGAPMGGRVVLRETEQRAFAEFCASLRRIPYSQERLLALREVAPYSYFTCYQAGELLSLFGAERDRLTVLGDIAPRLLDPQYGSELLGYFANPQMRLEAQRFFATPYARDQGSPYGRYERQMQEDFEHFYRTVKDEVFPEDQMRYIKLAAGERYFLVDQVKRLIDLFMWDDEKLQVLRLLAPCLYDGYNSYRLLNSFDYFEREKAQKILRLAKQRPRYMVP